MWDMADASPSVEATGAVPAAPVAESDAVNVAESDEDESGDEDESAA